MDKVRVFEAFCGYGSQALALERLKADYPEKFDFEVVGISDIEKYPLMAYQALHGHCPNFGDITKIDWAQVPDFDLFTYSFPCQSISLAGRREGLVEGSGTRSSLLWECKRAISAKKPKWLLMENVEALTFDKNLPQLQKWLLWLSKMGYNSYSEVLEATDYGVPQKRRRFFCVSVRTDCAPQPYYFPLPIGNGDLQKIFETDVSSTYDVKDNWFERVKKKHPKDYKKLLSDKFLKACAEGRTNAVVTDWTLKKMEKPTPTDPDSTPTLRSEEGTHGHPKIVFNVGSDFANHKFKVGKINKDCAMCFTAHNGINPDVVFEISNNQLMLQAHPMRGDASYTLTAINGRGREENVYEHVGEFVRVRKLTPREGFRLMGLRDSDIDKIQSWRDEKGKPISDNAQRAMAGNSIVVDVLYHIFRKLYVDTDCEKNQQIKLF